MGGFTYMAKVCSHLFLMPFPDDQGTVRTAAGAYISPLPVHLYMTDQRGKTALKETGFYLIQSHMTELNFCFCPAKKYYL